MRSLMRVLWLVFAACFAGAADVAAQRGAMPWRTGDPPPAVAGLRLGATRTTIDSVLGKPESVRPLSQGVEVLVYRSRGLALVYSEADSLAIIYLTTRGAGDVGGVRVGDPRDTVAARWGAPSESAETDDVYQVGRWVILTRLDSSRSRVEILGLGRVSEEAEAEAGPYDSTANAREDIAAALRASQADRKLVLIDFGANWCLDCIVLERLMGDSTVAPYLAANFRVVRVDVGRFDRNVDVSASYGNPIERGVPAVVVLSPAGTVVATTADGSLESARSATPEQILRFLRSWVAAAHR